MKASDREFLLSQAHIARDWMIGHAFPLWHEVGFRPGLGFADQLDFATGRDVSNKKRLRVLTRQIYVFVKASELGYPLGRQAVAQAIPLLRKTRLPGGGYASELDGSGRPLSTTIDTYDLAFVLFALGHAYSLLGHASIRTHALELLDFVNRRLIHKIAGYAEGSPPTLPRRQNPHMHLLEACLVWLPMEDGRSFRKLADDLVALHSTHFVDKETGAVREYFDEELRFVASSKQAEIEPGHLYEWYWLLGLYSKLTGQPTPAADNCYQFAQRYGKRSGFLAGGLTCTGAICSASVRLWPHAEWVRAETVRALRTGDIGNTDLRAALSALWRFLETPIRGLWYEHLDGDEPTFRESAVPASSLYHIVGALCALIYFSTTGQPFEPEDHDVPGQ